VSECAHSGDYVFQQGPNLRTTHIEFISSRRFRLPLVVQSLQRPPWVRQREAHLTRHVGQVDGNTLNPFGDSGLDTPHRGRIRFRGYQEGRHDRGSHGLTALLRWFVAFCEK
jgi:hypothetical protein